MHLPVISAAVGISCITADPSEPRELILWADFMNSRRSENILLFICVCRCFKKKINIQFLLGPGFIEIYQLREDI